MEIWGIDTKAVSEAIGLAKDGFGLVKEAGGVAGKLRDVFRANQDSATPPEVLALASSLGEKLVQAQLAQSEIMNRLLELEHTLEQADRRQQEADRYQLVAFPGSGALVLALKEGDPKGEPPHYLCHPCFEDGKKRILQPAGGYRTDMLECPRCNANHFPGGRSRGGVQTGWSTI